MDDSRFDALTRSLAKRQTRRGVLGGLAALAAGAVGLRGASAACPAGQVAGSGGRCVCRSTMRPPGVSGCPAGPGQTLCGGAAVDLSTDVNNCGTCGYACPPPAAGSCAGAPVCRAGTCLYPPLAAGTACNDGNACTEGDVCNGAGSCAGTPKNCAAAGDQCNDGVCRQSDGACVKQPKANGTTCNDGNACTQTDTCQAGQCVGGNPVVCTALDQCHVAGSCDPATGTCSNPNKANGTSCNDGNACTIGDTCQAGVCQGGAAVVCTASDQCHLAGVCDPATGSCSNPAKPDGTSCDDGNACTQLDTCQAGVCRSGAEKVCKASDQCHLAGTCDPTTGDCSNPAKVDGTACNDGNACTQTDTCQAGVCTGGNPVVCTASDQCHEAGVCDHATGQCSNPAKPNGMSCSDGNSCTQTDTCQNGVCSGGNPVQCPPPDQCHDAGVCDPATGICSNPAKPNGTPCNDGNACTIGETCQAGVCTGGTAVVCSASDQCHVAGTCNPATGTCSNPAKPEGTTCDDGNPNTVNDVCTAGICGGTDRCAGVTCTPQDQCHVAGVCDPATGLCSNPAKANGTACNDNNACTQTDTCQNGSCVGSNPVVCTASDQCHIAGVCDPATGICSNPDKANGTACNDGNACTQTDTCQNGVCSGTNPVVCPPPDQCHLPGVCNPATGLCSNPAKANGSPCNDGNACTQTDTCQTGVCTGSNPVVCQAQDQCHLAGVCNTATGVCSNPVAPDGTPCDDGDPSTSGDVCTGGVCGGSDRCTGVVCTAQDQCHDVGTCNPATGQCSNPPKADGAACDDGNRCTFSTTCQGGQCGGGFTVTCPAFDPCHFDGTCNPATGACSNPPKPNGTPCTSGGENGTCQEGNCRTPNNCPAEANSCTTGVWGCHNTSSCGCFQSFSHGAVCTDLNATGCNGSGCQSDADCAPGTFCGPTGPLCCGGSNICLTPCSV